MSWPRATQMARSPPEQWVGYSFQSQINIGFEMINEYALVVAILEQAKKDYSKMMEEVEVFLASEWFRMLCEVCSIDTDDTRMAIRGSTKKNNITITMDINNNNHLLLLQSIGKK
ncbi:MAG: hypothetical protein GY845_25395 [Planctomycetes bacterium]|nr:hypothetical protein [Planctomycetota bacterium]